jgi:RNA polymerase sigma factor (TIGR02999 family)
LWIREKKDIKIMQNDLLQTNPYQVTLLISKASAGDSEALNDLMPIIYDDLKRIAAGLRHKQFDVSRTLNTTSLVNEAWLKLQKWGIQAESRKHFFCITAKAMRQILINAATEKLTQKRDVKLVTFEDSGVDDNKDAEWIITLERILTPIEKQQPRMAEVFQLKYFLGFTEPEIAEVLDISMSSVSRDWLTVKKIIGNILK